MKKSDGAAPKTEPAELEFPDWNGMIETPHRITVETVFKLAWQYRQWFPQACRQRLAEPPVKCLVEFVL